MGGGVGPGITAGNVCAGAGSASGIVAGFTTNEPDKPFILTE